MIGICVKDLIKNRLQKFSIGQTILWMTLAAVKANPAKTTKNTPKNLMYLAGGLGS